MSAVIRRFIRSCFRVPWGRRPTPPAIPTRRRGRRKRRPYGSIVDPTIVGASLADARCRLEDEDRRTLGRGGFVRAHVHPRTLDARLAGQVPCADHPGLVHALVSGDGEISVYEYVYEYEGNPFLVDFSPYSYTYSYTQVSLAFTRLVRAGGDGLLFLTRWPHVSYSIWNALRSHKSAVAGGGQRRPYKEGQRNGCSPARGESARSSRRRSFRHLPPSLPGRTPRSLPGVRRCGHGANHFRGSQCRPAASRSSSSGAMS